VVPISNPSYWSLTGSGFGSAGVRTKNLPLERQICYYFSQAPSPGQFLISKYITILLEAVGKAN
jgi:hypothetical protein